MLSTLGSLWPLVGAHAQEEPANFAVTLAAALLVAAGVFMMTASRGESKLPRTRDGKPLPRPTATLPLLENTLDFVNNSARMHD